MAEGKANEIVNVGDTMKDGTVYGGISPDTNRPMYVRPCDESLTMRWHDAMNYAAGFEGHGRPAGTFRVPSEGELALLFQNRAKIGGFIETGDRPKGCYWSSKPGDNHTARDLNFKDGYPTNNTRFDNSAVRLVCD